MEFFGLDDETIKLIQNLFSEIESIEMVKIFGSRAKGNYKPASDIDFAIFGEIDSKGLRHIACELDELSTPYKFDILNYNEIENQALKESIDNYGKIFYKKVTFPLKRKDNFLKILKWLKSIFPVFLLKQKAGNY